MYSVSFPWNQTFNLKGTLRPHRASCGIGTAKLLLNKPGPVLPWRDIEGGESLLRAGLGAQHLQGGALPGDRARTELTLWHLGVWERTDRAGQAFGRKAPGGANRAF